MATNRPHKNLICKCAKCNRWDAKKTRLLESDELFQSQLAEINQLSRPLSKKMLAKSHRDYLDAMARNGLLKLK